MPNVSKTLGNLFDGVSTRPQSQRLASHADEQINALSLAQFSLARRPPLEHLAKIMSSTTGYADALFHEMRLTDDERYAVVVINGDLKVFSVANGTEVTVTFPDGKGYLTNVTRGFQAITVGEKTYIVNRAITVRSGIEASTPRVHEALVYVRLGDYDTRYAITINGIHIGATTTPAAGRAIIATDEIAEALKAALVAVTFVNDAFTITQLGSCLHIIRKDGQDFTVAAEDGLADAALIVVKESVQRFTDLPTKAVEGFTVEITGDNSTQFDNYYVRYTEIGTPKGAGVWREVVEPGTPISLAPETLPHVLEYAPPLEELEAEDFVEWLPSEVTTTASSPARVVRTLTFSGVLLFPVGCRVTLTYTHSLIHTVSYTYTNNTAAPVSANTVITALQALIDPNVDQEATVLSTNVLEVRYSPGGILFPGFSVTIGMNPVQAIYDGSLSMTVNEHVGRTIRNLTDGSEGIVASNNSTTVFCTGGLSGGAFNEFQPGDNCEITQAAVHFTFREEVWAARGAGDVNSAPLPSFVGEKIRDIFEWDSRLGFLAGPNVVMSRAGDTTNFFRQTATQLLADDPIDVRSALQEAPEFHSVCAWNNSLLLFSDMGQFQLYQLSDDLALSPTTVSLKQIGSYQSEAGVRPLVQGKRVFFVSDRSGVPLLQELRVRGAEQEIAAIDTTRHVPAYIVGPPLQIAGDDTRGILFFRTDDDLGSLYVYVYVDADGDGVGQSAWSRWEMGGDTEIVGVTALRGSLLVLSKHSDGLYLSTMVLDTSENPAAQLTPITAYAWFNGVYSFNGVITFSGQ